MMTKPPMDTFSYIYYVEAILKLCSFGVAYFHDNRQLNAPNDVAIDRAGRKFVAAIADAQIVRAISRKPEAVRFRATFLPTLSTALVAGRAALLT